MQPVTAAAPDACLGCARLENPDYPRVTLANGREVSSWCECWRVECHDRHRDAVRLLSIPSREVRRRELETIAAVRGAEYGARLEAEVRRQWEARRAGATA